MKKGMNLKIALGIHNHTVTILQHHCSLALLAGTGFYCWR